MNAVGIILLAVACLATGYGIGFARGIYAEIKELFRAMDEVFERTVRPLPTHDAIVAADTLCAILHEMHKEEKQRGRKL